MKKVNWSFRVIASFLVIVVLLTACQREEFEIDENGNAVQTDNSNSAEGEEGALSLYSINGSEISLLKDFDVKSKYKSDQDDKAKHQKMWDYFIKLIPVEARGQIVEFEVFHGDGELLGYVAPIDDADLSRWKMGLAIDATGDLSRIDLATEFAYTAIHEYGHVLTLDNTQIDVISAGGSCGAFHIDEGCSKQNSYINELYLIGWSDIMSEFKEVKNDRQATRFYEKYQDRFVTEYAASNPAEDVAEVFSVFVTSDSEPRGNTIADKKVRAMYGHPALIALRDKIRTNEVVRALKAGSWKRPKCKHDHNHDSATH